jgi:hypothetical protein
MGKGVFSQKVHNIIQFASFALIAIGMPSTKILMSLGLVFAIANWVLEGGFSEKWNGIRTNRLLQLLLLIYLLLIVGVIWSWDSFQGLKDIKSRLPILFLPLILGTSPLMKEKQIQWLLHLFLASLFVTSLYNVLYFNDVFGNYLPDDIRGLSRFASHIRYGLIISLGFGMCIWFQLHSKKFNILYSILTVWFAFYTIYSQVLSGIIAFTLVCVVITFFLLYQWQRIIGLSFAGIFLVCIGWSFAYLFNLSHEDIDCGKLPEYTEKGERYDHSCLAFSEINGKAILAYYSEREMFLEWNEISDMDFMGSDKKGQMLRMTAARYMTSLGLTKDAKGISKLTTEDIQNIEEGYTYPNEKNEILKPRLYGIKFQILNNRFPNGHSLLQRIEHWKTAVFIINRYWLTGVGTGGNQKAFDWAYEETDSPLYPENRLRSHNMFLAYTVSYGIWGLLLFVTLLGAIVYYAWKDKNLLSLIFFVVVFGSFFTEDTLETQLGGNIFGFFLAISIYYQRKKRQK